MPFRHSFYGFWAALLLFFGLLAPAAAQRGGDDGLGQRGGVGGGKNELSEKESSDEAGHGDECDQPQRAVAREHTAPPAPTSALRAALLNDIVVGKATQKVDVSVAFRPIDGKYLALEGVSCPLG